MHQPSCCILTRESTRQAGDTAEGSQGGSSGLPSLAHTQDSTSGTQERQVGGDISAGEVSEED